MRTHYGPWQPCWISNQHQKHKSGRGPSNEHVWQVWLKSVQQFQRSIVKCEKLTMDNIIHILVLCESIELADFSIWSINHFLFNVPSLVHIHTFSAVKKICCTFLPVSKVRTNKSYIFRQCYIEYICSWIPGNNIVCGGVAETLNRKWFMDQMLKSANSMLSHSTSIWIILSI
jgi:hypothetical protein